MAASRLEPKEESAMGFASESWLFGAGRGVQMTEGARMARR